MNNKRIKTLYLSIKILFISFILIFYFFFPNYFVNYSHKLFSPLFRVYSHPMEVLKLDETENTYDSLFPLRTIAKPPQVSYDTLILYKGNSLVSEGEYVYEREGLLVGYINNVLTKNNVSVILFSSPNIENTVSIKGYVTKATGLGSGGIIATVPKTIEIEIGDELIHQESNTSIGEVIRIEENEDEVTNSVFANIYINPFRVNELYLKRKQND